MPATVTLATTTLNFEVKSGEGEVNLASVTGISTGMCLWIGKELMKVLSVSGNMVKVRRGEGGTADTRHSSSSLVTIGRPDQFFMMDPHGDPPNVISVSPHINTLNATVWLAQGDANALAQNYRYWVNVTSTYGVGPLGVNTIVSAPTSST